MLNIIFNRDVIDELLDKYGEEQQSIILIEEMSELTKELVKNMRGKDNYYSLVEEMAHVLLSLNVVARALGISVNDLQDRLNIKFLDMDIPAVSGWWPHPSIIEYDLEKHQKCKSIAYKGEYVTDDNEEEDTENDDR